jgi:hypothetical protein
MDLQAKYGGLTLGKPEEQKKKKRSGLTGFVEGLARGAVAGPATLLNANIVNPAKSLGNDVSYLTAKATGNKRAAQNAYKKKQVKDKEINRELGLGESGEDLAGGLKKIGGAGAETGLLFAGGGASTIPRAFSKNALIGSGTGAASTLQQEGATLEDTLTGGVMGGLTGGLLGAGGGVVSKLRGGSRAAGKTGQALDAEASGIGMGQPLKGGRSVTPDYEAELLDFAREGSKKYSPNGVKTGKPRAQAQSAQEVFNGTNSALSSRLKQIDRAVELPDRTTISNRVQGLIDEDAMVTGEAKTFAKFQQKIEKAKSLQDLEKIRKEADNIAFSNEKAGKTSAASQSRHVRDVIDDYVSAEDDVYKAIKGDYRKAKDLLDLTSKGGKQASNSGAARTPLVDVRFGGQGLAGAKSKAGGLLQRVGSGPSRVPSAAEDLSMGVLGRATRQGLTSQAGASAVPQEEDFMAGEDTGLLEGELLDAGMYEEEPEDTSSPFHPSNAEKNAASILAQGGDMKDVAEYMSLVESFAELSGGGKQKPLNATQQQRALTSGSGLRSLDTLEGALTSDPGAFARQALPNPFGIAGRLTGTTDIRAATDNVVDVIARLRSGAAITDDEAKRFARLLPQAGDSTESARRKIQNVRTELESFANPAYAEEDLTSSLNNYR